MSVLAAAAALTKLLKFYVNVFKMLHFLNPQMDLVYTFVHVFGIIIDVGPKSLSPINTPAYDL